MFKAGQRQDLLQNSKTLIKWRGALTFRHELSEFAAVEEGGDWRIAQGGFHSLTLEVT